MTSTDLMRRGPDLLSKGLSPAVLRVEEWIVLGLLSLFFLVHAFVPGWRALNSDFPNYYLGALLHHRGIPLDRIYEWTWFQRQNDHLAVRDGIVGYSPNPPSALLPTLALTRFSPLTAKRVWLMLNLFFLALSWLVLHHYTALGWRRLCLITLVCVAPLHSNFLLGQYYVLLLLLLCLAYFAHRSGRRLTSGILIGAAAALKLVPAAFLILFIGRRNWRALTGMALGAAGLTAASVGIFGVEVHRVFLDEVLPQVSRGDWTAPYELQRNTFITFWSHIFLREPDLNPTPLISSPALYAIAMSLTTVALIFGFLWCLNRKASAPASALEWSAFVLLALMLSSTSGSYHPTLMIFTAVVGSDSLLRAKRKYKAIALLLLYVLASAPIPGNFAQHAPPMRLIAMTAMYVLLLSELAEPRRIHFAWVATAVFATGLLAVLNFRAVGNREVEYGRRLNVPTAGFRSAEPVPIPDGIAFTEMLQKRYDAETLQQSTIKDLFDKGDVLSVAATNTYPFLYAELASGQSFIQRVALDSPSTGSERLVEGQEPSVSHNGQWLAYIRDDGGRSSAWVVPTNWEHAPRMVLQDPIRPLDISSTDDGDLIASVGSASDPHLLIARRGTGALEPIAAISGPARYPILSPDGERLAYSRRERGFWHLVVLHIPSGAEQQLTEGSCNATSPSWKDNQTIFYATDCGRAIPLTTIAQVSLSK